MGIGSHFNCCGKGNLGVSINMKIDDDRNENNINEKNTAEENNMYKSNENTNGDYTFQAKSSHNTNSSYVVAKNNSILNKGPFIPNTIEQKNIKGVMESFDEMFEKLN